MSNNQFSVSYNGHPVAITVLENNTYLVQITYKPIRIRFQKDERDTERWVDLETQQETYLSNEIGKLIDAHLSVAEEISA